MADHHLEHKKVNKPANSNFRQQRLVAWQPIMSPPHVVACLMVVALAFAPIGIAILFANRDAVDVEYRYDDLRRCSLSNNDGIFTYNSSSGGYTSQGCRTVVNFTLTETMTAPVYMYYKLTNFYQNHRRFAKSRSVSQLAGNNPDSGNMDDCDPLKVPGDITGKEGTVATVNGGNITYGGMKYSPCGLVAWSMFNDSFMLYKRETSGATSLVCDGTQFSKFSNQPLAGAGNCTKDGITWDSDSDKFKTPAFGNDIWTANRNYYDGVTLLNTSDAFISNGWYAGEAGHEVPVVNDQDMQVWMRTAALPNFRKLYRRINVDLPAGDYSMVVNEFYPVESFSGSKSFALATISWLGGKNTFLGVAYLVVGGLSFVLGIIFFIVYKANGDRMQAAIESLSELQ